MADINQVITLGIGTPSDISHFTLFGLSPDTTPDVVFDFGLTTVVFPAPKRVRMPEAKQVTMPDRHTVEFDE